MMMTEKEIYEDYMKASDKKTRIKALAEMNDCGTSDIKEILENQGVEQQPKPEVKRGRPSKNKEEVEKIPVSISNFARARLTQLTEVIASTEEELKKMKAEKQELERFLKSHNEKFN